MVNENSELISVDLSHISQETELVNLFISQLNLPDLYGDSLHSLGEHFYYDPMLKIPNKIRLLGFEQFSLSKPNLASELLSILRTNPKLVVEIVNA